MSYFFALLISALLGTAAPGDSHGGVFSAPQVPCDSHGGVFIEQQP